MLTFVNENRLKTFNDKAIVDSWNKNARPWITAIQEKQIASRQLVTNQAIIDAIVSVLPQTVLDIGCGEGWLVRALSDLGISCSGLDIIPELIEDANKYATGDFLVLAYEKISFETIAKKFDIAVCNFSLLGKESVEYVFKSVPSVLNPGGYFIVQTLNPRECSNQKEYEDGWREGSWAGFSDDFYDPAPWYFRTTESWIDLFHLHGYELVHQKEPINPITGKPVSLILIGRGISV